VERGPPRVADELGPHGQHQHATAGLTDRPDPEELLKAQPSMILST
jgi:hypothetical protein